MVKTGVTGKNGVDTAGLNSSRPKRVTVPDQEKRETRNPKEKSNRNVKTPATWFAEAFLPGMSFEFRPSNFGFEQGQFQAITL